jgi:hypothetical protein
MRSCSIGFLHATHAAKPLPFDPDLFEKRAQEYSISFQIAL